MKKKDRKYCFAKITFIVHTRLVMFMIKFIFIFIFTFHSIFKNCSYLNATGIFNIAFILKVILVKCIQEMSTKRTTKFFFTESEILTMVCNKDVDKIFKDENVLSHKKNKCSVDGKRYTLL